MNRDARSSGSAATAMGCCGGSAGCSCLGADQWASCLGQWWQLHLRDSRASAAGGFHGLEDNSERRPAVRNPGPKDFAGDSVIGYGCGMSLRGSFIPQTNVALFLDVDGTLLEIAATPSAVRVPAALRNTLQLAAKREDGALALISGRTLAEIDVLFDPHIYPAAAQHGLEIRIRKAT